MPDERLRADAAACGQKLPRLALEQLGQEVQGVRGDGLELALDASTYLSAGDAVLLAGPLEAIEAGEARLLGGLR